MFKIDLKKTAALRSRLGAEPSAAVDAARSIAPAAAALAVLVGGLWLVTSRMDGSIAGRKAEAVKLEAAVESSRKELAEISGRRRLLYDTQRAEVFWSDQLRMLSEKVPDKVWVTQVKVVASGGGEKGGPVTRKLSIEGGVLSNPSEGNLDLIGKFIEELQADRRFQENFSAVTLESVKRAGGDPYTLVFQLRVDFRSA